MSEKKWIQLFKPFVATDAHERVKATLESGYLGQGPRVEEFEKEFARLENLPWKAYALSSGTIALDLAYHLIGVGPGTEVISTPMTCCATNTPIVCRGAHIVWADVNPDTGLIDPEDVKAKITKRTKAIVASDWGGRVCDYEALKSFGIPVVQDGAHSLLTDGGLLGETRGDYRMWSFQAIKHLTTGDGGALFVPKKDCERLELLRWYGLDRRKGFAFRCKQDIEEAGYKAGMNDIAASIGLANLPHARSIVKKQTANASYYQEHIEDIACRKKAPWSSNCSWWLYTVLVSNVDAFIDHMKMLSIEVSPVHSRNDTKAALKYVSGDLVGVDLFAGKECCIPVGWWLSDEDKERVAIAVNMYKADQW